MLAYLLKRVVFLIFVLLGIATLLFFVARIVPADPARLAAGLEATAKQVELVRERMGLNKPLHIQYFNFLGSLLHGDLGTSMFTHRPVLTDMLQYLPATIELALTTMVLATVIAVVLGVVTAIGRGRLLDVLIRILVNAGTGMPQFWSALLLQLVFFKMLGLFPATGRIDMLLARPQHITGFYVLDSLVTGNWGTLASSLQHMVLPVTALLLARLAILTRVTRAKMLQVLDTDYIQVARSKGLPERVIILKHALRNALIPVATILGLQFSSLLGGTVLVETVFAWPGIGRYAANSILSFDFPAVTAVAMMAALFFSVGNLMIDILYGILNPRIRY